MDNPTISWRITEATGNALAAGADIPGVVAAAFTALAEHHRERATWLADNRKKGWKSAGEMLTFAAEQLESAAGELENGEAVTVTDPAAVQRCASFRRATADDDAICTLPRGHDGHHAQERDEDGRMVGVARWPRKHSGELCRIKPPPPLLVGVEHCLKPLGHDGEHAAPDSSGVEWTWVYGQDPVRHDPEMPEQEHDNQCASVSMGERCALTAVPPHTGNHIGTRGGRWPQDSADPGEPAVKFMNNGSAGETVITEVDPATVKLTVGAGGTVHTSLTGKTEDGRTVTIENLPTGHVESVTAVIPEQRTEEPSMDAPNPFGPVEVYRAPSIVVPLLPTTPVKMRDYDSVSSIESMAGCGMKYRLHYHENAPETPAWWLVGGKAFHRVVEEIERNATKGITTTEAQAESAWAEAFAVTAQLEEKATGVPRQHWRAAKGTKAGGPENEAWWQREGAAMSVRYLIGRRELIDDGWELLRNGAGDLALELEFRFPLGFYGREIRGFIDSVWINQAKRLVLVVDDKSGARPPESTFQLETYAAAVAALLAGSEMESWPVLGTYYNARKGSYGARIQIDTSAAAQIADARSAMTAASERAGVFLPRVTNMCKGCGVAASCPVMALKASTPMGSAADSVIEAPEWDAS